MKARRILPILGLLAAAAAAPAGAARIALPSTAPAPTAAPEPSQSPDKAGKNGGTAKDGQPSKADTPAQGGQGPLPSDDPPVPQPKPDEPAPAPDVAPLPAEPPPSDPRSSAPRSTQMPAEETACRRELGALGARFEDRPGQWGDAGCAMPWPVSVTDFGSGVAVKPDLEVSCPLALGAARFVRDVVQPESRRWVGKPVESISQASGYVCRNRNGSAKLSEHAFGNALDIAAFTFADGKSLGVNATPPDEASRHFMEAVRKAACGPFKTVLGPGSDSDHAEHFHLDLAPRRHGGTVCE